MAVKNAKKILVLKRRRAREAERRFLIEGVRLAEEALRSDVQVDQMVFCRDDLPKHPRLAELFGEARRRGIPVDQTDRRAMVGMCETQTPQGVLGVVRMPDRNRDHAIAQKAAILLLDRIRDPGNLGLILRTAEAAGAGALFLSPGSVELYNPKVVRASMGSIFRLPAFPNEDLPDLIRSLLETGTRVFSAHLEGTPFHHIRPEGPFALLLGNEAFGVDPALNAFADTSVSIPMGEGVESLNIAVAAGILLYRFSQPSLSPTR